jgi:bifunctional UDP-N-acetylglucosamine pyrophosphorylase/glucosamine-1-phosphate N-acetyltransferase
MRLAGVVLAAGLGKRMNSSLPKVLQKLHGTAMLQHVLNTLRKLKPVKIIVIVGKRSGSVKESLHDTGMVSFAEQREAKGTGDALLKALPALKGFGGTVLVVNGDTPLITRETLKKFLTLHLRRENDVSLLSFVAENPASYGRVIRDGSDGVIRIVEDRDATESEKKIAEVNSGVYAMDPAALHLLKEIPLNEAKGEYYLTEIVRIAREKGMKIDAFCIGSEDEFIGVNTRDELQKAKQFMKDRIVRKLLDKGVSFLDPHSVFLSSDIRIGSGTTIYPNVHLEGKTTVGSNCIIYPNVRIRDSAIGDGAVVKDSTLIECSVVKKNASVGPFAHVRPGSEIGSGARIGNFVEVKKAVIGSGTKASHLSYIGDAKIGKDVNIGAGTITCNYDGHMKHVTLIEEGVFIGSDTQLIAPVRIGKGAYVGAGSTITKNVPSKALALSRAKQINIEGWAIKRKVKGKKRKVESERRKTQSAKR